MANLNQAFQSAMQIINASAAVLSVNIEFLSEISGPMTATVNRNGMLSNICKL